ncbi:MAG: homocysteine S-methyltransferase family protein [Lentisphaeria bacterium]|nr:homocysteine S-methyltransferase family protein [Lentisphaeria bacterium]
MNRGEFRALAASRILLLDGATGTELAKRGMPAGVCPELWACEHPEAMRDIRRRYLAAGSDIVYAPTFGGNRCKFSEFGLADRVREIVSELAAAAKADAPDALVFGDIAPTGKFVEPCGDLPFEEAVAVFRESAEALLDGGVDGFAIETMMDLQEARAALLAVREVAPDLPVLVTMTFESGGRSLTGVHPVAALNALQSLGADAFGCNCSTGPKEMAEIIAAMAPYARIPLVAKPNAGLPRLEGGRTVFPMGPDEFSACAEALVTAGAGILGGCCGTSPAHIARLSEAAEGVPPPQLPASPPALISSVSEIVEVSTHAPFTVIGERINPTGKKAFQAELRANRTDMALDFALQQVAAGAKILDINMGLSGIDEAGMMRQTMTRLLKAVSAPLCIDSTDPETVETALRLYPGRALLNSVSAEKRKLEKILPLAAKYGAMPILLPLTDAGIPATADERMAVLEDILAACAEYGYTPADVCADALIMTVSAEARAARTSLEFISRCRERGIATVCGLSNVSFGMPARPLLNRTFLGMAMGRGLNLAIANPLFPELMEMTLAGDALLDRDPNMAKFLDRFAAAPPETARPSAAAESVSPAEQLRRTILRGDAEAVPARIDELLKLGTPPAEILNAILIPAITEVGQKYEQKEFFLPQLISGAEAMQRGTACLEQLLSDANAETGAAGKPKIIIATVKGDIHDIGKNIVAVVLRNYGLDVVDLGKDVPPEVIIDTAVRENVRVVCLSALMTTTMGAMRETVALARKRGRNELRFIVGGAVVDQCFADELGACYGADPMSTMRHARRLLEQNDSVPKE